MTIAYMDLFYILSIGGIVAVLIMMEAQINQIKKMMEEKKYVYIYTRGKKEFITGSYQVAINRNHSGDIYAIDIEDGVKYIVS